MKRSTALHAGQVFAALLVLATVWFFARVTVRTTGALTDLEDNNPQKFHLWVTGTSFSYTFTCDPHAADLWMFRTAGGTRLILPPRSNTPSLPTNYWPGRNESVTTPSGK